MILSPTLEIRPARGYNRAMTIDFFQSSDVPQPKEKIKIERLESQPYPDGWRVKITVEVTPFQERPNLEIRVLPSGDERPVATLSVIETMHRHMEFTVHIRGVPSPVGSYVTTVDLFYDDPALPQDHREEPFSVEVA
jgi:hypothetical protein